MVGAALCVGNTAVNVWGCVSSAVNVDARETIKLLGTKSATPRRVWTSVWVVVNARTHDGTGVNNTTL